MEPKPKGSGGIPAWDGAMPAPPPPSGPPPQWPRPPPPPAPTDLRYNKDSEEVVRGGWSGRMVGIMDHYSNRDWTSIETIIAAARVGEIPSGTGWRAEKIHQLFDAHEAHDWGTVEKIIAVAREKFDNCIRRGQAKCNAFPMHA